MHRFDLRRLGLGTMVGLLVFWVAPVSAQSSAPLERDWMVSIHAEVVEKGQPVEGLTLEDFVVKDKGKEVEVVEVVELDFEDCDSGPVERPLPQLFFLFDFEFSDPRFLIDAFEVAREMIAPDRSACSEILIATHEWGIGLRIEEELTTDRDRLLKTLATLQEMAAGRVGSSVVSAGPTVSGDDLIDLGATQQAQISAVQIEQGRILALVRSLARLESLTRTVPGSAQVVVFSSGFDSSVILGNQATQLYDASASAAQSEAAARGETWNVGSSDRYHGGLVEKALFEMLSDYDRAGVPIHGVKVKPAPGTYRPVERGAQSTNGLSILANRTGGEIFRGTRDELAEETRALEPTGSIYLLTFKPRSLDSGRYRKLDVRLKKSAKGVKVLAPRGYFVP